ncbi:TPA: competence protein ComA [Mannheimia haemolytica]
MMKLLKLTPKHLLKPISFGLSEDEQHYCLVKNEAKKFTVYWQTKNRGIESLMHNINLQQPMMRLIRPIPYQYIWRKIVFMPKNINEAQLHRKVIHILNNEQPLTLDLLNIDYQRFPSSNNNLDKVAIYAVRKSYTDNISQFNSILDCELHCYARAVLHLTQQANHQPLPCFSFKQKWVEFTETELLFPQTEPNHCIHLSDLNLKHIEMPSEQAKQLYCLALGASLWNGKALI